MAEQKQVKKKKEKKKKKDKDEEEVEFDPTEDYKHPGLKPEFKDPRLRKEIVKLRKKFMGWEQISKEIGGSFNVKISKPTAKQIFQEELAKSTVVSPSSQKSFGKYNKIIEEQYEKLKELTDWWLEALKKSKEYILAEDIMTDPRSFLKFLKITESIDKGTRNVLEQLKFIREDQENIKMEQKNYFMSPVQINQHLTTVLRSLEKSGTITINKDISKEINFKGGKKDERGKETED